MPEIPERKQRQLFSLIQKWVPHQLSQQEPAQRHHSDGAQHMVETHSLPLVAEAAKTKLLLVTEVD